MSFVIPFSTSALMLMVRNRSSSFSYSMPREPLLSNVRFGLRVASRRRDRNMDDEPAGGAIPPTSKPNTTSNLRLRLLCDRQTVTAAGPCHCGRRSATADDAAARSCGHHTRRTIVVIIVARHRSRVTETRRANDFLRFKIILPRRKYVCINNVLIDRINTHKTFLYTCTRFKIA